MIELVIQNMSDMRINYFTGENSLLYANLSCGQRESNFAYDGVSTNKVECGVLSLEFKNVYSYNSICIELTIDDDTKEYVLSHSPFENKYMVDLGFIVKSDSVVSFNLKNQEEVCTLFCISQNWAVDYEKAISIGANTLLSDLEKMYSNGTLHAECYLKVVQKNDYDQIFWYFSVIDKNGTLYSMLINVSDGSIQKRES